MENWNLVYETATGQAVSLGTVLANPLPAHLSAITLTEEESTHLLDGTLVWDPSTLSLIPAPRPFQTALEHLQSVGLGGDYQPTLIYLRINLTAANKSCPELDALEAYLQGVLAIFAQDQNPRNDWTLPPITFQDAVIAAMAQLSTNN
jgi:hypothetical protein